MLRSALALVALLGASAPTTAAAGGDSSAALAVEIACPGPGRTQACPMALRQLVDATPLVRPAEPGAADVTLSFTATARDAVDRAVLRFTASLDGAPTPSSP